MRREGRTLGLARHVPPRDGRPTDLDFDALLEEPLKEVDLPLEVSLGDGPGESRLLASDLSHGYVSLNSDYRS